MAPVLTLPERYISNFHANATHTIVKINIPHEINKPHVLLVNHHAGKRCAKKTTQCLTNDNSLTMNMVPIVGHALLPNIDFMILSKNEKTFGTQIPNANMTMIKSLSNFVCIMV